MKIIDNITVYKCEFCSKKLFRKHAMLNHEKKCTANPLNIRKCFDCDACERVNILYERSPQGMDEELAKSTTFKCQAKEDTFMFPPKLEHREDGISDYVLYEGKEILQKPMPLLCDKFRKFTFNWNV